MCRQNPVRCTLYLLFPQYSKVVAFLDLRPITLRWAPEGVACLSVLLKLSVLQLNVTVLVEAVETENVSVRAVEDKDNIAVGERKKEREGGEGRKKRCSGREEWRDGGREKERRKFVTKIMQAYPFFLICPSPLPSYPASKQEAHSTPTVFFLSMCRATHESSSSVGCPAHLKKNSYIHVHVHVYYMYRAICVHHMYMYLHHTYKYMYVYMYDTCTCTL